MNRADPQGNNDGGKTWITQTIASLGEQQSGGWDGLGYRPRR